MQPFMTNDAPQRHTADAAISHKSARTLPMGIGRFLRMATRFAIAAAAVFCLVAGAHAQNASAGNGKKASYASIIVAGGCFWCVEADFEKLDAVTSAVSGYSGGLTENPTYRAVTKGDTGHLEVVKVYYDPSATTYRALVEFFLRTIDPLDDGGQFCDRGSSYRTAIFAETADERAAALEAVAAAEQKLGKKIVTPVRDRVKFWRAEEYHQDYYKKNRLKYSIYRSGCGRDKRLKQVWGDDAGA